MEEQLDDYIFPSTDFEDPSFSPAAFVAKYRRVSSLESLKTQLRQYSEALKQQLFEIINRDYKDFIGIATKLDGVDTRVEVLRRPLVDLRLDLSSLHDWLMTSLQALDSKLSKKMVIRSKKRKIESAIKCLDKLDVAEHIIEGSVRKEEEGEDEGNEEGRNTDRDFSFLKRRELVKALGKLRAYHLVSPTLRYGPFEGSSSHQKDIFEASELERAAYSLASAQSHLSVLHSARSGEMVNKESKEEGPGAGYPGSLANGRDSGDSGTSDDLNGVGAQDNAVSHTNTILLEQRSNRLMEQLLAKIRGWFEESLASGDASGVNSDDASTKEDQAVRELGKRRLLKHCLCALQVMERLDIAEAAVAECVLPHAKATLTQGRVDGGGGRGSFGGLEAALLTVLSKLDQPVLSLLATAEGMGCDLVIGGAWLPIITLISERFPAMFSVGIASVMADCMRAFEAFHTSLSTKLLGPEHANALTRRFATDSRVVTFRDRWNLDLYLKLRAQEVRARLDRACSMCTTNGLVANSLQALYDAPAPAPTSATPTNKDKKGDTGIEQESHVPLARTLTAPELAKLRQSLSLPSSPSPASFQLALTIACATEAATCLHAKVYFPSLASSLLAVAVRCVARYEAHVCLSIGGATPSFPSGPGALRGVIDSTGETIVVAGEEGVGEAGPNSSGGTGEESMITPQKGGAPSPQRTPFTATTKVNPKSNTSSGVSANSISLDDCVLLVLDVHSLATWFRSQFLPHATGVINVTAASSAEEDPGESGPVEAIVTEVCENLRGTGQAVWKRAMSLLLEECKGHLVAVRAVAGRYRMTNRPAPTAPSAYVETILTPLKTFISRYGSSTANISPRGPSSTCAAGWDGDLVEDITAAFLFNVNAVLDTARQMDSALARRSKATGAGAATTASDSDKIHIQLALDVRAYEAAISALGVTPALIPSLAVLKEAVVDKK